MSGLETHDHKPSMKELTMKALGREVTEKRNSWFHRGCKQTSGKGGAVFSGEQETLVLILRISRVQHGKDGMDKKKILFE